MGELLKYVRQGNLPLVSQLLEQGVDPDFYPGNVNPPLIIALWMGHKQIFLKLLQFNANPCVCDIQGYSALMLSMILEDDFFFYALMECSPEVNGFYNHPFSMNEKTLCTPLMFSVLRDGFFVGKSEYVGFSMFNSLINSEHIDLRDTVGRTALMYGAQFSNNELILLELVCKSNLNIRDNSLRTPLMYSAMNEKSMFAFLLLLPQQDVNFANCEGKTALMYAAQNPKFSTFMVQHLLNHGARLDRTDNCNKKAVHYAVCDKTKELLTFNVPRTKSSAELKISQAIYNFFARENHYDKAVGENNTVVEHRC